MVVWPWQRLFVLFGEIKLKIFLLLILIFPHICLADGIINYSDWECIKSELLQEVELKTKYLWAATGKTQGEPGDCSGKLFAVFRRCGVPVLRTEARVMTRENNASGWDGKMVEYEKAIPGTLVGMTTQEHRPHGHIGITISNKKNNLRFYQMVKPYNVLSSMIKEPPNKWYVFSDGRFKNLFMEK